MLRRSYQGRVKKQSTEDCDDQGIELKSQWHRRAERSSRRRSLRQCRRSIGAWCS